MSKKQNSEWRNTDLLGMINYHLVMAINANNKVEQDHHREIADAMHLELNIRMDETHPHLMRR